MKQRTLICLTMAFLLAVCLCGTALAANIPTVDMQLSENRLSGPKEISVTISVTNTADTDMPGPIALYNPDGARIEEFGQPTLAAGATKSWTGTWMVTEKQLAEGRIAFALAYYVEDESGVLIAKTTTFYKTIVLMGAEPEVEVRRTITPSTARNGQKVSVIYEISNVGAVDVTDVVIKESSAISSKDGRIALIKAGEKATHTFTVTMGKKDLTSRATVTYAAGGQSYTKTVGDAQIKYGNVKLVASLKADKKGGPVGDTVKLTLTLENTGKVDYQNVTVTDPLLGTVFTGLAVEAGQTLTQEKELTISQNCDLQFTVSGTSASGDTVETATDRISLVAVDPANEVSLTVLAEADHTTIYMLPGIVRFTVHVTNTSAVEAKDVTVSASNVDLYSFDSIAAGQTESFVRDVRVDVTGKFRFDARTANQLGERVVFNSNEVQIVYSLPTATPSQVPLATPEMPQLEEVPTSLAPDTADWRDSARPVVSVIKWVGLLLTLAFLALIVVGIVGRSANAARSNSAADHLTRSGGSDYTQAVSPRKRRMLPDDEAAQAPVQAAQVNYMATEPSDVPAPAQPAPAADMQQAMNTLYPEAQAEVLEVAVDEVDVVVETEAPAVQETAPATEATYQRRRRTSEDE